MIPEKFRLQSVVRNGVGGVGAGAIGLMYSHLLIQKHLLHYSIIFVNQVGNDLQEFVMKEGNKVHMNIRYPAPENFEILSETERARIRLDVAHRGLLLLSEKDPRYSKQMLEEIRDEILENDFNFDLVLKEWHSEKFNLTAKLVVLPKENVFEYYVVIVQDDKQVCKVYLYNGKCNLFYLNDIFNQAKWKSLNELIISGKAKQANFHIFIDESKLVLENLTAYEKPPLFELMKAIVTDDKAYENWLHSLPPAAAAIIRGANN